MWFHRMAGVIGIIPNVRIVKVRDSFLCGVAIPQCRARVDIVNWSQAVDHFDICGLWIIWDHGRVRSSQASVNSGSTSLVTFEVDRVTIWFGRGDEKFERLDNRKWGQRLYRRSNDFRCDSVFDQEGGEINWQSKGIEVVKRDQKLEVNWFSKWWTWWTYGAFQSESEI